MAPSWPVMPGPEFRRFRARTVDEARAMYSEYGQRVDVRDVRIREPFDCSVTVVQIGPLELSRHRLPAGLEVHIDRDDLYGIGVGASGQVMVRKRGGDVMVGADRAVTTDPRSGPMLLRPGDVCELDCLVIDQPALEYQLGRTLGYPIRRPLPFAGEIDLTKHCGRSLRDLMRVVMDDIDNADSVVHQPLVAGPLSQTLINAVLLTSDHEYSAELRSPFTRHVSRRPVKQAIDAVHAHPEDRHTSASLAELAGVSVRTLQAAFHQQLGISPMAYLRQVRLEHVHNDLRAGAGRTVAEVAHRWGFAHLGRFSTAYRATYGVAPSSTLRGPAGESAKTSPGHDIM